jgi:hypothetical protein
MMSTLYDTNNDWEIEAIKFRGTIYLCAKETELKLVILRFIYACDFAMRFCIVP